MSLTTRSIYGNPLLVAPVPAGYHCGDLVVDQTGAVPGFTVLVGPFLAPIPVYVDPAALALLVPDVITLTTTSTGPGNLAILATITNPAAAVVGRSLQLGFAASAPVLASSSIGQLALSATPVEGTGIGRATPDTLNIIFNGASGTTVEVILSTLGPSSSFATLSSVLP
jgi:hypothetical protein